MNYYKLALPVKLPQFFTYYSHLSITPGVRAEVEFGRRRITGIVWGRTEEIPPVEIKPIIKVLEEEPALSSSLMKMAEELSRKYLYPVAAYAELMLPPRALEERKALFAPTPEGVFAYFDASEKQREFLELLIKHPLSRRSLQRRTGKKPDYFLRKFEKNGYLIRIYESREKRKVPWSPKQQPYLFSHIPEIELTQEAEKVLENIKSSLFKGYSQHLIFGVTGSGKTFIYMKLIEEVVKKGGGVIYLVPEITMVPFPYQLLSREFEGVEIIHSLQTPRSRLESWKNLSSGRSRIALGARSALFYPVRSLKLIIIDEEHDSAYEQEEAPRYSAIEAARIRAQIEGATLILGSATPRIETFAKAKSGEIQLHTIRTRIKGVSLPETEIVSMKKEVHLVSSRFAELLKKEKEKGNQALILINRRGFSSIYQCTNCGYTAKCPHCELTLTYHKESQLLNCHYCDYTEETYERCPVCQGEMKPSGMPGVERIKESVLKQVPQLKVERFDAEVASKKRESNRILREFYEGKIDVLVGTQLLSKGHNFPGVKLVGVFFPDFVLNFPDFRSSERTFQLLTQMIGRAGRTAKGKAVIQTYIPENYVIKEAASQNYEAFFSKEIDFRRTLGYPPFRKLVRILIEHRSRERAGLKARALLAVLKQRWKVKGPAFAPFRKLRGKFRVHMFLDFADEKEFASFRDFYFQNYRLFVDASVIVDPYEIL